MIKPGRPPAGGWALLSTMLPGKGVIEYGAGEKIFSQGEKCTDVHYIEQGAVKLTLVSRRGRGAVLGILGRGDFFGQACIRDEAATYSTSAVAITASSIVTIKRRTMVRLLAKNPPLAAYFIDYLLQHSHKVELNWIDHLLNTSEKRLARTLLLLAQHDERSDDPPILSSIGQDTLAEMVGTTRSRVSFFMNRFRKLGFIQYNGTLLVRKALIGVLQD